MYWHESIATPGFLPEFSGQPSQELSQTLKPRALFSAALLGAGSPANLNPKPKNRVKGSGSRVYIENRAPCELWRCGKSCKGLGDFKDLSKTVGASGEPAKLRQADTPWDLQIFI